MKVAFSAKKVAVTTGVAVLGLMAATVVYASLSDSSGIPVLDAISSAINPAKSMANQVAASGESSSPEDSDYISASKIAVNSSGQIAFVNDETAQKVYKLDLSTNKKVSEVTIGEKVNNIVVNGSDLYVLYGGLDGKVAKYNFSLQPSGNPVSVGHTPSAGAVYGTNLYVANRFTNDVSVIDTSSMTVKDTIKVSREPIEVAIANGNLYVASHLQDGAANGKNVSAKVSVINLTTKETSYIKLLNGSGNVEGICASPDGNYIYVSHILARYGYPITQLDRGWVNTNAVSIIKTSDNSVWNTVLLDQVDLGAGNPWGIAATQDKLVVAISGTHEAMVIDRAKMHQKITDVESGKTVVKTLTSADKIPDYLNFLDGARTRIALTGKAPRGVAIANGKAYFTQYFSGNVCVLDLTSNATSTISLGEQPEADQVRRGEALWYDASNYYQKWESCASCHPDSARMDSLNWDTLGDGLGNPKSTKSILYSYRTPPTTVTGVGKSTEASVRGGIPYNELSEEDNLAIDAFLKSLRPEQSPYLNKDGTLTANAQAGKQIFQQTCASCHSGPFFTDMQLHNSNINYSGWEKEKNTKYDTPTLIEVWRTGPWGKDGSFKTMREYVDALLSSMENAPSLTDKQKDQLCEYVLSIGNEGEYYGLEQVRINDNGVITANTIIPGSTIEKITFRRQLETNDDAIATFELFDNTGKSLKKVTLELSHTMSMRYPASVDVNYTVPKDLPKNSYFTVNIVKKSNPSVKLATEFRSDYKG